MHVLIVDDDRELCALLEEFLSGEGIAVSVAHSGPEGLRRAEEEGFDLVILDVMLPGMDGLSVLGALRRESDVGVIMLTARGKEVDRIVGLELGADDYLPKPFSARELLARMRAVGRRPRQTEIRPQRIETGRILLNASAREVVCDGTPVELTGVEFDLLEMLMRSPDRVLSRDEIMDRMHGRAAGPMDRSIDMHISHLRKKLGAASRSIKTVRGVGYRFLAAPEAETVET